MYTLSERSKVQYDTLHPDLKRIIDVALMRSKRDFSVVWGYRGEQLQNKFYKSGNSDLPYPRSKHNHKNKMGDIESLAFDFCVYPVDWNDTNGFIYLAGLFIGIAEELGIKVKWGGLWKSRDLGHIELEKE